VVRAETIRVGPVGMTTARDIAAEHELASIQCTLCAFAGAAEDPPNLCEDDFVVAHLSEQTVVLLSSRLEGALVAPTRHAGGLTELPEHSLSCTLASLRLVSASIQEVFRCSGTKIEPWEAPPSNIGHVCFLVYPAIRGLAKSSPPEEMTTRTRALAESLEVALPLANATAATNTDPQ
jgi:hypothetical protein